MKKKATFMERVSYNLRRIRTEKDMTQNEVEARAGLSRGYVSLLENGARETTLDTMSALAVALGVDVTELAKEIK